LPIDTTSAPSNTGKISFNATQQLAGGYVNRPRDTTETLTPPHIEEKTDFISRSIDFTNPGRVRSTFVCISSREAIGWLANFH
jgi:hypothetical protein